MTDLRPFLVAGIDPGSHKTGYAFLAISEGRMAPTSYGVITPPAKLDLAGRCVFIHERLGALLREMRPAEAALEDLFFHRSASSAFKLGQARGVILLTLALGGVEVHSYAPAMIKKCVTCYGAADKAQVGAMVKAILGIREALPPDASDAFALALTHARAVQSRLAMARAAR